MDKLTILAISDTHGQHRKLTNLPKTDIIIHCGDIMTSGRNMDELADFLNWFDSLNYRRKIFIGGNHDRLIETDRYVLNSLLEDVDKRVVYLEHDFHEYRGVVFYGSPFTPEFCNWSFQNYDNESVIKRFDTIVDKKVDVMIMHGPVKGICDKIEEIDGSIRHVGCDIQLEYVNKINPMLHLSGHIHEGGSLDVTENTIFANCSVLDENYELKDSPYHVFSLEDGKVTILNLKEL